MLFDLRGSGRRRTVKIVYITLAFLMGGGLVLFGIGGGGALPGGLVDAITQSGGGGGDGNDRFVQQERAGDRRGARQPDDAEHWAAVARARFNLANAGDNVDQSTGNYTDAGAEQLRAAGRAWEEQRGRSRARSADSRVASLMVQAYARPGRAREGDRRAGDRRAGPRLRRRVRHPGDARLPGEPDAHGRPGEGQGARAHRAGHARVAAGQLEAARAQAAQASGQAAPTPDADAGGEVAARLQSDAAPL